MSQTVPLRRALRGLYGIVDLPADAAASDAIAAARPLLRAGVGVVQLRMKGGPAASMLACARALRRETRGRAWLCVNDRLDIALLAEAELVHLGQDDLSLEAARRVAAGRIGIGISTHSIEQVERALAGGADYLGYGPIFATRSKERPDPVQGVEVLREVTRRAGATPVVALGGITSETAPLVAAAGATAIAAIAAIREVSDPYGAARALIDAFSLGRARAQEDAQDER